jgi:hypothetical protein
MGAGAVQSCATDMLSAAGDARAQQLLMCARGPVLQFPAPCCAGGHLQLRRHPDGGVCQERHRRRAADRGRHGGVRDVRLEGAPPGTNTQVFSVQAPGPDAPFSFCYRRLLQCCLTWACCRLRPAGARSDAGCCHLGVVQEQKRKKLFY